MPACSIRAGLNAAYPLWQVSHCAVVGMWLVGLPSAAWLLWQIEHWPTASAACTKLTVAQVVVVVWQVSHCAVVVTCVAGLTCAFCAR